MKRTAAGVFVTSLIAFGCKTPTVGHAVVSPPASEVPPVAVATATTPEVAPPPPADDEKAKLPTGADPHDPNLLIEGGSLATAVSVPVDVDDIDFELAWISRHYGPFRKTFGGTAVHEGRRYEVIRVELPDKSTHEIFFDITENWNNWKPPTPPK